MASEYAEPWLCPLDWPRPNFRCDWVALVLLSGQRHRNLVAWAHGLEAWRDGLSLGMLEPKLVCTRVRAWLSASGPLDFIRAQALL